MSIDNRKVWELEEEFFDVEEEREYWTHRALTFATLRVRKELDQAKKELKRLNQQRAELESKRSTIEKQPMRELLRPLVPVVSPTAEGWELRITLAKGNNVNPMTSDCHSLAS